MKIQLDNNTHYRDDDLRAIVRAALQVVCFPQQKLRTLVVHVVYTRQPDYVTGKAYLGSYKRPGHYMWLRLPKEKVNLADAVRVTHHEVLHLVGARHKDMTKEQRRCHGHPLPDWGTGLQLRKNEPKSTRKPKASVDDKLKHAEAMHKKALTRLKRATTIEKKWRQKLSRLRRQL